MPEVLGQDGQLGADVAVADDAERPAADLVGAVGVLVPDAGVHRRVLLGQAPGQRDDLRDRELDHAAGIGERRVEDGDALAGGGGEVDLIGADAERADRREPVGSTEYASTDLCLRTDAEQCHARDPLDQLVLVQAASRGLDEVTLGLQSHYRFRVDILQQQCTDLSVASHRIVSVSSRECQRKAPL